jgi:hypothetical protein
MKKLYILSLSLITSFGFSQVVLTESFNYTVGTNVGGNLATANDAVGANNWLTHSNTATTGTGSLDVLTGNLSYTGLATSTGNKILLPGNNGTTPRDINRVITSTATTLFMSFLINVLDNTQLNDLAPNYFIGFGGAAGTSVTTLGCRVGITSSNTNANYKLHIQNISGGTPTYTANATDLAFGTTYLVVVKYDRAAAPTVAYLWVNPTSLGGPEPAPTVTNNSGTTAITSLASVFLRNSGSSTTISGTPKAEIDEIRVGATWADVTPTTTAKVNQNEIAGLSIYPNPVSNGTLFINTDANDERNVAIFDVLGKQVINVTTSSSAINVSNLNGGVYIVKVIENGKTATRKLVIK